MLNLPTLHTYLTQLLSPADTIHTALLLTPEGAVVSFACSSMEGNATQLVASSSSTNGYTTPPQALSVNGRMTPPQGQTTPPQGRTPSLPRRTTPQMLLHALPSSASKRNVPLERQRSKDEIWILAGLSAEVWAETRGEGDGKGVGMVESEVS